VKGINCVNSGGSGDSFNVDMARQHSDRAMRLVCASLPWLSGLAYTVQIVPDQRVSVAAVTESGRVMINPEVFTTITLSEAAFVLAHELLHLALDTFSRESVTDDHGTVNRAHDYIINDMLREELGMEPPLGGLELYGCSKWSLEQMVHWMSDNKPKVPTACWTLNGGIGSGPSGGSLSGALREAGILPKSPSQRPSTPEVSDAWHLEHLDVIPLAMEQRLFPGHIGNAEQDSPGAAEPRSERVRREVVNSLALREVAQVLDRQVRRGTSRGNYEDSVSALRRRYATPWETALQRWMEATAPGARTYSRPSRRGADRVDCVLPGRTREGWTLHIVLDTSGSMIDTLPRVLGAIAMFCENTGVSDVHILQCDVAVTVDEWIPVEELEHYRIAGYGGSDMSPAMDRLADDPEVTAMLVITDGCIGYPQQEPLCRVLWVLTEDFHFNPPYGEVLELWS
jgi:predicted metal-dependent peptidase